jgi:hypothetical protein
MRTYHIQLLRFGNEILREISVMPHLGWKDIALVVVVVAL